MQRKFIIPDDNHEAGDNNKSEVKAESHDVTLPNELLEKLFITALKSSEQTRQQFLVLNSTMEQIANNLVYEIYVEGSKERLDFEIGKYFYSPSNSDLKAAEIAFLLTHPNATPNLYVFTEIIDTNHFTNSASNIFFIRQDDLLKGENFITSFKRTRSPYSFLLKPKDKNSKYTYHYGKFTANTLLYHAFIEKNEAQIELLMKARAQFNLLKSKTDLLFSMENNYFLINGNIVYPDDDIHALFFVNQATNLLKDSIKTDNEFVLACLLKYTPRLIKLYDDIWNAMKQAVSFNSKKAIKLLLEFGVDMTKVSIHDGARIGDKNLITYFLNKGISIDEKNSQHLTPLEIAIDHGQLGAIDFLVDQNVSLRDKEKDIPIWLQRAIFTWNMDVFKKCLSIYLYIHAALKTDPKIYMQKVFNYLINIKNFDKLSDDNLSVFNCEKGYLIYDYLNKQLSLSKWDLLTQFAEILIDTPTIFKGYAYIKNCLISLFQDYDFDIIDPLGNTLLHYFIQWPIFNDFYEPLKLRLCANRENHERQTAFHYISKKFSQNKNADEKATYLKNICELTGNHIPCLSPDSSGFLPGDYLLSTSFKKEWQDANFQAVCRKFVFPIMLSKLTNGDWKDYTRLHKAVVYMTAEDLDCLLTELKETGKYDLFPISKNKQSILHVAVHCNKVDNLKIIAKHNIVKITSPLIKDITGKIAMDYAKREDVINELAAISGNSLTSLDADDAIAAYKKDKIFISSKETKQAIVDLKKPSNNYQRFFVAEKYVNANPQKRFASHLRPKITPPVRTLTEEILKFKK